MQFIYLSFNWPIEKFLGFLLFLIIIVIGFWCLVYIFFIIPYWIIAFVKKNKEFNGQLLNLTNSCNVHKNKKLYKNNYDKLIYKKNVIKNCN